MVIEASQKDFVAEIMNHLALMKISVLQLRNLPQKNTVNELQLQLLINVKNAENLDLVINSLKNKINIKEI